MTTAAAEKLAALLEQTAPPTSAERAAQLLPAPAALEHLLPDGGLMRGTAVEIPDMALLLAMAGAAVTNPDGVAALNGWCVSIGLRELGLLAATRHGIDPERLLIVDRPGQHWADIVLAMLPAVDVIITAVPERLEPRQGHRITAALRKSRAVMLTPGTWQGSQLRLSVEEPRYYGLGPGHGLISGRQVTVSVTGRGAAGGPTSRARVWLPDEHGRLSAVDEVASEVASTRGLSAV